MRVADERKISALTAEQKALVAEHIGLVELHAALFLKKYAGLIEHDDLLQLGYLGLSTSAVRYQANVGVSFAQYATHRVRGAMLDGIRTEAHEVRVSLAARVAASRYLSVHRNEFKLMEHSEEDAQVMFDEFADNLLVVMFDAMVETALEPAGEDSQIAREIRARAAGALASAKAKLPEQDRQLLFLIFHEDRTQEEAAVEMGLSVSTVYRRTQQILQFMRLELERWLVTHPPLSMDLDQPSVLTEV